MLRAVLTSLLAACLLPATLCAQVSPQGPINVKVQPGQTVTIQVEGVGAEPGPGPNPPTPIGPIAKFVVFEETVKAGQFRGQILTSKAVQQYVIASRMQWRVVDVDSAKNAPDIAAQFTEVTGKPLPHLFLVDAAGKTIKSLPCPTKSPDDFLAVFKPAQAKYAMGNIKPAGGLKNKWLKVGEGAVPISSIPRTQWVSTSLEAFLPPVRDQGSVGKCNAVATANAFMMARRISGLSFQDLSDDYIYGNICFKDRWGRRQDSGSLLEDGLKWMQTNGTCTRSVVRDGNWNPQAWPAQAASEAQEFVVEEAYLCQDFDAVASAIQQGFPVIVGIDWYDNFFQVDADGWLPMRPGQPAGGHAIVCYGVSQRNGVWGADCRNSWGATWGRSGNFTIPEQHFRGQVGGFWAIRSVKQTRATVSAQQPVSGLLDSVKWLRIMAGIKSAVSNQDYAKILTYAEQIAALVGYGNVANDIAAITKAVAAKDWAALVPPLVDLLQFGIKQFGVAGSEVPAAIETRAVIDQLQASVVASSQVPTTAAPVGKRWVKDGDLNSPAPWRLEDVSPPAPMVMPMPANRPALQFFNQMRPGVLQSCPNGGCQLAQ